MKVIQVILIVIMASLPTFANFKFNKIGDCNLQPINRNYKIKLICYKTKFDKNILSNLSSVQCRDSDSFKKNQVTMAEFMNCEMDMLPKGFFEIYSKVNVLDISNMKLKTFPTDSSDDISSLVNLDASLNSLTEAPSFPNSNDLTNLDLSNNPIMVLNALSFENLKKLTNLNLANTGLIEIPEDIFLNQEYLRVVDLSNNFLTTIDMKELLPSYYTLETLYLDDNSLTKLNEMPRSIFSRLNLLSLINNQVTCDKLRKFVNSNGLEGVRLSKNTDYDIENLIEYQQFCKHYVETPLPVDLIDTDV